MNSFSALKAKRKRERDGEKRLFNFEKLCVNIFKKLSDGLDGMGEE